MNHEETVIQQQNPIDSIKQVDPAIFQSVDESTLLEVNSLGKGLSMDNRKTVDLSKDFAQQILELPEFAGDRPLRDDHVAYLKNAMERGTFLPETVQIITCKLETDGKTYRMNGQHTCWARWFVDTKKDFKLPVQHLKYIAKTEEDMRRLYASIDRNAPRTKGNIAVAYLYGTEQFEGFTKPIIQRLSEGLAFWLWDADHIRQRHDSDERAFLMKTEHYNLAILVGNTLKACKQKDHSHLIRRPVVAAMFATFAKSKKEAETFWNSVKEGTGMVAVNDPRLKLRNELTRASLNMGKGQGPDAKTTSSEEMYRWCLLAWNAYRSGLPLKVLRAQMKFNRPALK